MKTEEFWDLYMGAKDIKKIFDQTYDFFSKKLPAEFVENYGVGEVILETRGHQETAKEFGNVLKFTALLQQKHPDIYKEYFQYFDDFLIDYYAFLGKDKEVEKAFSNFIEDPEPVCDQLVLCLKKILFYQYDALLDKIITRTYDTINNSEKLMGNAAFELAINKYYINLENFYLKAEKAEDFDRGGFAESMIPFEFDIDQKTLVALDKGLFQYDFTKEKVGTTFRKDRDNLLQTLKGAFLTEMQNKGFHFVLGGRLWDLMMQFWGEQSERIDKSGGTYFSVTPAPFEKYLSELTGDFFMDNTPEMIAALWGSVYVYDFLLSKELISQITYDQFKETSKILKGKVIGQYTSSLWNYNFMHHWTKPDSISETEFDEEGKIFQKSLVLKPKEFSELKNEIDEELGRIGDLSAYIVKGGTKYPPSTQTVRNEMKIQRNDPCPCGSGKKYKKCCGKNA